MAKLFRLRVWHLSSESLAPVHSYSAPIESNFIGAETFLEQVWGKAFALGVLIFPEKYTENQISYSSIPVSKILEVKVFEVE